VDWRLGVERGGLGRAEEEEGRDPGGGWNSGSGWEYSWNCGDARKGCVAVGNSISVVLPAYSVTPFRM
jgi:hypothetical protein